MASPSSSPTLTRHRPTHLVLPTTMSLSTSPAHSPKLGQFSTSPTTPKTPDPCTPPALHNGVFSYMAGPRRALLRRKSSLSSVGSGWSEDSSECGGLEDRNQEWTQEEEEELSRTLESYLAAAATTDARPPTNLAHLVARAAEVSKVNHGIKATRKKVLAIVKNNNSTQHPHDTPRASTPPSKTDDSLRDPDATPRAPGPAHRAPMVRQGSMDFLPEQTRDFAHVARLGSKLHHAAPPPSASTGAGYGYAGHPYSRPSNSMKMQRTHSLSSIAGSPTQPPGPAATASKSKAKSGGMARTASVGGGTMLTFGGSGSTGLNIHHSHGAAFLGAALNAGIGSGLDVPRGGLLLGGGIADGGGGMGLGLHSPFITNTGFHTPMAITPDDNEHYLDAFPLPLLSAPARPKGDYFSLRRESEPTDLPRMMVTAPPSTCDSISLATTESSSDTSSASSHAMFNSYSWWSASSSASSAESATTDSESETDLSHPDKQQRHEFLSFGSKKRRASSSVGLGITQGPALRNKTSLSTLLADRMALDGKSGNSVSETEDDMVPALEC